MAVENPYFAVYSALADKDVLLTIAYPQDYDTSAVEAAQFEFQKRNLQDIDVEAVRIAHLELRKQKQQYTKKIKVKTGNYFTFLKSFLEKWGRVRKHDRLAFLLILLFTIIYFVFYLVLLKQNIEYFKFMLFDFNLIDFLMLHGQFLLITTGYILFILLRRAGWAIITFNYAINLTGSTFGFLQFLLNPENEKYSFEGVFIQNPVLFFALVIFLNAVMLFILCIPRVRSVFGGRALNAFFLIVLGSVVAFSFWSDSFNETGLFVLFGLTTIYLFVFILITKNKKVIEVKPELALDHNIFETIENTSVEPQVVISNELPDQWMEDLHQAIRKLQKQIVKSSSSRLYVLEMIREKCTDKESGFSMLEQYNAQFNRNLLDDLASLSSSFTAVKENLDPFIRFGLAEAEYPHKRIDS